MPIIENEQKFRLEQERLISVSFVMLKPLGTQEPIRSKIIDKLSEESTIISSLKISPSREQMFDLYKSNGLHDNGDPKPYLNPMLDYYEGKEIEIVLIMGNKPTQQLIDDVDKKIGFWNPNQSEQGEIRHLMKEYDIRYDLAKDYDNLIHSPATPEDLERELAIFVNEETITKWK